MEEEEAEEARRAEEAFQKRQEARARARRAPARCANGQRARRLARVILQGPRPIGRKGCSDQLGRCPSDLEKACGVRWGGCCCSRF